MIRQTPGPDDPYDPRETELVLQELEAGPDVEYPAEKELVLRGRAAIAQREYNPDDTVPPEVDDMLRAGIPRTTLEVYEYQWGRFIHWCGVTGREHKPPTVATLRYYIWSHWSARRPDGQGRGRRGRPYAHATVKTAIYSVSAVLQWMGEPSPARHPFIRRQLNGYFDRWTAAGHRPDIAHAFTPEEAVASARACDLSTVQGLRLATMMRLQDDLGARASEIIGLDVADVSWIQVGDRPQIRLWIKKSKTRKAGRALIVEAVPDVDGDVDPVLLTGRWVDALRAAGRADGPLFPEVNPAPPRKDGALAGSIGSSRITLRAYEKAHDRAVTRAGVDRDPKTGLPRRTTNHGRRRGMITTARNLGMLAEQVAPRTGHELGSNTIHEYWGGSTQTGDDNAGTRIRTSRRKDPST